MRNLLANSTSHSHELRYQQESQTYVFHAIDYLSYLHKLCHNNKLFDDHSFLDAKIRKKCVSQNRQISKIKPTSKSISTSLKKQLSQSIPVSAIPIYQIKWVPPIFGKPRKERKHTRYGSLLESVPVKKLKSPAVWKKNSGSIEIGGIKTFKNQYPITDIIITSPHCINSQRRKEGPIFNKGICKIIVAPAHRKSSFINSKEKKCHQKIKKNNMKTGLKST